MKSRLILMLIFVSGLAGTARAASPEAAILGGASLETLSGSLRDYFITALPSPLLVSNNNWGHQTRVANGVKWRGQGLGVHPEVQYTFKNDGNWRRLTLTAPRLPSSLVFELRNLQHSKNAPATFDAFIAFDVDAEYERQTWSGGTRIYSGSTRARFRVKLSLKCELTSRLEKTDSLFPNIVFRFRVLHADIGYDDLVVEHTAGIGGELAKFFGDVAKGVMRLNPEWEWSLLEKGNAAIVKAADTKEVRIGLDKLIKR